LLTVNFTESLIVTTVSEAPTVSLKNIVVPSGRSRKTFTRIEELSESIKTKGFIHPILVTTIPERAGFYQLVAGERRYRAAILAGLLEVPVTFRDNLTELEQKVLELEENVCRKDIDWAEQAENIAQIDALKQKTETNWDQQKTADLVYQSRGHVSLQIKMAKKLRADPELKAKIKDKPIRVAMKLIEQQEEVERSVRLQASGQLQITTELALGNCLDLIKELPDNTVDLLLTDPPYGISNIEDLRDGGSLKMPGHQLMSDTHNLSLEGILDLLRSLAPELVRVLKPGAHFYVFSAMQYCGAFVEALAPLEFQPPVLIWDRGKPTTPGYGYNYLNRTETIIYGYNPPRSRRLAKNTYNILSHPEVPSTIRTYPTEKPQSLLRELMEQSTVAGHTVLDPFAGSASCLKAARDIGRKAIGFEIDEDAWQRAQMNLAENGDE